MSDTTGRAYNFNPGPAALPLEVLRQAQEELIDYRGSGMSIMEMSHRSKMYEQVHNEAQENLRELLKLPDHFKVLFLQGGASTQFAMVPMNFARAGRPASYVQTGSWSNKAIAEARLFGEVHIAASSKDRNYTYIPREFDIHPDSTYVHITSNETIGGIQYASFPDTGGIPLVADMSSDILSRPIDVDKFALIYAGAQKNLGPSGVTIVLIREDMLAEVPDSIPTMLRYDVFSKNNSLYNTPPVFSIYMVNLVLRWLRKQGGLEAIEAYNRKKTSLLYDVIDQSGGFYRGVAEPSSRSVMNVTFRLPDERLEQRFIEQSLREGFVGLAGHRSVGGLRASTYNAVTYESCAALAEFMKRFLEENG